MSRDTSALRVPPQSVEAEQAVLGALMLVPASINKVCDIVTEDDFYRRDHRLIYRGIMALNDKKKPFDAVTLGEWFDSEKLAEEIGGTSYLIQLASTTPSAANVKAYAQIVAEKAERRRLIDAGSNTVNDAFQATDKTSEELVAEAMSRMLAFKHKSRTGGLKLGQAGMKEWFGGFQERMLEGRWITGLPTPWEELNKATRGLPVGLTILAGRPSMGKSIAAQELCDFTALRGCRTAMFSIEMTEEENHQRSISRKAGVPHDFLVAPGAPEYADKVDWYLELINPAAKELFNIPLLIDDESGLTAYQVAGRARRAHAEHPLRLIVIDHLHDIKIKGVDAVREYGEACQIFKDLAKELGIPVVVVAQLNRGLSSRTEKRPGLMDLRASGEIEQKADLVIFVHREDYYDTEEKKTHLQGVVELSIGKGRNMRSGRIIYLHNEFEFMRLGAWEGELPEKPQESADSPRKRNKRGMQDEPFGG